MITQARQTEYKGIVYRSKSEAMFAASLDFLGEKWIYEPRFYCVDGWTPDFAIPVHNGNVFSFVLIELKPSLATDTYINELALRFESIDRAGYVPFTGYLACFSWFDTKGKCDQAWAYEQKTLKQFNRVSYMWVTKESYEFAKSYRFDLKHQSNHEVSEMDLMLQINRAKERSNAT